MKTNKEFDEYIESAQPFAQPILMHLRKLIHQAHPDIAETIKWGMPHYEYKGVICSTAGFKEHVAFGFWKEKLIPGMMEYIKEKEAQGLWGRITSLKGLPPDKDIIRFVEIAVELNEKGIKIKHEGNKKAAVLKVPDYLTKALKTDKKALTTFEAFSQSNKNEYIEWLIDAKSEATKDKRLKTAIEWMAEGKTRLWKYQGK